MSIKNPFKEQNMGLQCDENPDGSKICRRIKVKDGERYSTGTDVELSLEDNCRVRVSGTIKDSDRGSIDQEIKRMEDKCKRGF